MSIKLMSQVWEREISGTEQQVLLIMCDHAHDDGRPARPSVRLIAWKLGLSSRTIQRAIRSLEDKGALAATPRAGTSSLYGINLEALPSKQPLTELCHPRQNVTPDTAMSPTPDIAVSQTPDKAMSPEPLGTIKEPLKGKSSKRKPETTFPDNFVVDGKAMDFAVEQGMAESRARYEFERMHNWAEINDARRRDWFAQWRNWVIKDIQDNGKGASGGTWVAHKGGQYGQPREIERPDLIGPERLAWEKARYEQRKRDEQEARRASS